MPAGPVREHVIALGREGVGLKTVANAAGVSAASLSKLVRGVLRADGTHRPPSRTVTRATAVKVLAVTSSSRAGGANVDSTGTRRRLQALATCGWSLPQVAKRCGVNRQALDRVLAGGPLVLARTAQAVAVTYDALWSTPAPCGTAPERAAAARTRNAARAGRYPPPFAWDEDTIDDPDALAQHAVEDDGTLVDDAAVARALAGDRSVVLTRFERAAGLRQLVEAGLSDRAMAELLGVSDKTVLLDRQRLGLPSRWVPGGAR